MWMALIPLIWLLSSGAGWANTVHGTIMYEDRQYGYYGLMGIEEKPVRFARVEVVRSSDQSDQSVIGSARTLLDGSYAVLIPPDTGSMEFYVRVYAMQNDSQFQITVKTANCPNPIHIMTSGPQAYADGSVEVNLLATEISGLGGAFNIFDVLVGAAMVMRDITGVETIPLVKAFWNQGNREGSYFVGNANAMYLLGIPEDRDEYDDDVILHEYGHFIARNFSSDESPGGSHRIDLHYDLRLAWSEGWANFLSSALRGSQTYVDTTLHGAIYIDWELPFMDAQLRGSDNEGAVAAILWDIFDAPSPDDDPFSEGMAPIWGVMTGYMPTALHPSVEDFWDGWFQRLGATYLQDDLQALFLGRDVEFIEDEYESDNSRIAARRVITDGSLYHHTHYPVGDEDWICFDAEAGSPYVIETLNLTNYADTHIYLYDRDGVTLLSENDDRAGVVQPSPPLTGYYSSRIDFVPTSSGRYYVAIRRYTGPLQIGTYGSYDFKVTRQTIQTILADGDIAPWGDRDGRINIGDAVVALRCEINMLTPTAEDVLHGDVAPLFTNTCGALEPNPDGTINIGDAVVILRAVVGLVSWEGMAAR